MVPMESVSVHKTQPFCKGGPAQMARQSVRQGTTAPEQIRTGGPVLKNPEKER